MVQGLDDMLLIKLSNISTSQHGVGFISGLNFIYFSILLDEQLTFRRGRDLARFYESITVDCIPSRVGSPETF